jgi:putative ABC transport system permease protein
VVGLAYLLGWILEERTMRTERVHRIIHTLMGVGLVAIWGVRWSRLFKGPGFETIGDIWFILNFVLGAPLLILGAILLVMFNADTLSALVSRLFGGVSFLTPVLRTAIAYPLNARFRTGMAMVLFAMIITTVTLMTVVIQATQTLVTPDTERYAGFEIGVYSGILSFFDPLEDIEAEIPSKPDFPSEQVAAVGSVTNWSADARQITPQIGADEQARYTSLAGVNAGYLAQAEQVYSFSRRAEGYASDAEVWAALAERDDVAVITSQMLREISETSNELSPEATLAPPGEEAVEEDETDGPPRMGDEERRFPLYIGVPAGIGETLPEITVELQSVDQPALTLQVIGVIEQETTLAGQDMWVNQTILNRIAGEAVAPGEFYIKTVEGADVRQVAQATERAFLNNAVNATVLAESFAQAQALTRGILQLFQGFLALGLLVGIAALGVISTRTVVERRQQVGMLRAIGFQPFMVALSFLLESSFIALTGIVVGASVGVRLGQSLVGSSYEAVSDGRVFAIPWGQIAIIVLIAYGFSLLTTILPAMQASRIYPAEALRYE